MIRAARPGEGERLREIARAAKAHWGYPAEVVDAWADAADFTGGREVFVAEVEGRSVAFASVIPHGDVCVLEDLWVEPGTIGAGVGTALFRRAAERARDLGASRLEWEAEPNAVGFYERMGGRYLRDSEPSEWGRILPVMGIELHEREP